jgi:hypothetical protein
MNMKKHVFWMEFESICCNTLIWKLQKIIDVSVFEILLDFIVVEIAIKPHNNCSNLIPINTNTYNRN